ncbi:hypothetical protein [Rhizobium wenxiniae]
MFATLSDKAGTTGRKLIYSIARRDILIGETAALELSAATTQGG